MSIAASNRVWATDIQPSGRKLVALKLANHCDDSGGSLFVGMRAIARDCGMSRSQAQRHMHALIDAGLLAVVANAGGGTRGAVPHYRLQVERLSIPAAMGSVDATRSTGAARSSDATGSVHTTPRADIAGDAEKASEVRALGHADTVGSTDAAGSVDATGRTNAARGSHGCGDGVAPMRRTGSAHATQTINNHQLTNIEAIKRPPAPIAPTVDVRIADLCAGVDEQVWQDWVALRTKKKAPVTRTALSAIVAEATKAGLSLTEALTLCCTRGWTGFGAEWVRRDDRTAAKPATRHSGFTNLDYREGINHDGSFV